MKHTGNKGLAAQPTSLVVWDNTWEGTMLRFASGAGRMGREDAIGIGPHPDAELARHHRAHLRGRREAGNTRWGRRLASVSMKSLPRPLNAVVIGSPTRFHFDQIRAAVAAGDRANRASSSKGKD